MASWISQLFFLPFLSVFFFLVFFFFYVCYFFKIFCCLLSRMSFSFLTHHFSKLLRTKDRCVCIGYQMYNHIHVALNSTKTASFFRQIEMTYPRSYVLSKDVMTCMYFRLPSRRSNAWTYRTQRFGSSKPLLQLHKSQEGMYETPHTTHAGLWFKSWNPVGHNL